MNAIFTRTSVRSFENREIESEKIEKIMQAAMASPTAKNQQAWEFYVVTNKEILQKLGEVLNLPENITAFTIFAFGYPKNKNPQKSRYDANKIHYVK